MPKKIKNNKNILGNAFKSSLGKKPKPFKQSKAELPMETGGEIETSEKNLSVREIFSSASQNLSDKLSKWWETGSPESDDDTPEKRDDGAVKSAINSLMAENLKSTATLKEILSEITLLRKITEGSVKLNKKGIGSKYIDSGTGKFISTDAARKTYNAILNETGKSSDKPVLSKVSTPANKEFLEPAKTITKPEKSSTNVLKEKLMNWWTTGNFKETSLNKSTSNTIKGSDNKNPLFVSIVPQKSTKFFPGADEVKQESASVDSKPGTVPDIDLNLGKNPPAGAKVPAGANAAPGGFLSKAANFVGGKGGLVTAGLAGAIGGGMYAYDKITGASEKQEKATSEAQQELAAGKITKDEYLTKLNQAKETANIEKGEGIGGGVGRFGGAIAGAKVGASFGSFFGPAGTVVGGLAGGALGYMAGGSIGEAVGNIGGRISNFFGGNKTDKTENKFTTKTANFSVSENGKTITGEYRDGKYYINGKEVNEKEYKEIRETLGLSKNDNLLSGKTSPSGALEERKKALADGASPEEADRIADKKLKYGSVISAGQGRGDVYGGKILSEKSESNLIPALSSRTGSVMQEYSTANKDLIMDRNSSPTIINNNNSTPQQQQPPQIVPIKPGVRPDISSLSRYLDKISAY